MTPPPTFPKREFLQILRRGGVPAKTVQEVADNLADPVDLDRDAEFLLQRGITRSSLVSRMGGSP